VPLSRVDARGADALFTVAAVARPTISLIASVFDEFTLNDLDSAVDVAVIEVAGDRVRFTHPLLASTHLA
jgi:hypothetical protein